MQFRPLALVSAIMLAGFGLPAHVHALSLESIQTSSALGQSFRGSLVLGGVTDVAPSASCIRVEDTDSGLPGIGAVRVAVRPNGNDWIISLRSVQRINEPAVQFRVSVNCGGMNLAREYSVLLDLPSDIVTATGEESVPAATGAGASKAPSARSIREARSKAAATSTRRAKKNIRLKKRSSQAAASAPVVQDRATAALRDAVKLAAVPEAGPTGKREAELMAQAEDQAAQLRQMEIRIAELQSVIDKMRVHIPEAELARLNLPKNASAAGAVAAASEGIASSAAAPDAGASSTSASAAMASESAASAASASALAGKHNPFDWMFWVWVSAAILGVAAFLAYVLRQKRIEKEQAWGGQVTEELLDSYAPVRRAELIAKMNAEAEAMQIEQPAAAPPVAPVSEAPAAVERDTAVEFVDVQHSASAQEEAQWLISHGEGERAIALLREEIRTNPDQVELWLMLFEYLFNHKKNLEFVTLAHRFRRQATGSEAWKQVCDMGLKLDPENRLFLSRNG